MFNIEPKLVIGLGNPGEEYKKTYHNVGFLFVDSLIENNKDTEWEYAKSFEYAKRGDILLAKPSTFMNNSGRAVREMLSKFGFTPDEIVIVHDDSDIQLGRYKIAVSGTSAGHKGIESIIQSLGTDKFMRLRIGIRHKEGKAEEFVLETIRRGDGKILGKLFAEIEASYFKA